MSVPTHEPGCSSRTWETTCRDCRKAVWFFSCSCGSKIFFDDLGPPWPKHYDSCLHYRVRQSRNAGGSSLEELRILVQRKAKELGTAVEQSVLRVFDELSYRETGRAIQVRVHPSGDAYHFKGRISIVSPQVNLYKRLKYVDNKIGQALLGKLAKTPHSEIQLIEEPDDDSGLSPTFEVFIEKRLIEAAIVKHGDKVRATIAPYLLKDGKRLWLAQSISKEG